MPFPDNAEISCMDCGATGATTHPLTHKPTCPTIQPTRNPRPSEAEIMAERAKRECTFDNTGDGNCLHAGCAPAGKCLERVVGDVTSDARGSGARFNGGKPAVDLIPVWIIAATATASTRSDGNGKRLDVYEAREILNELGEWQRGGVSALLVLQAFESDWIADAASVFDYGRKKYAAWNWAKGMPWSVPTACAVRHLLAILKGEINDPESDRPHRGHVACNIVMLAQYEKTYREGDDRPLKWLSPPAAKPSKPRNDWHMPEGPALNQTRDVSYRWSDSI